MCIEGCSRLAVRTVMVLLVAALPFFAGRVRAQCVVINEILINPSGPCDGSCTPNTEEWVELYNTCDQVLDLSCYVLSDGDFHVTFPPGTSIGPHNFLVIGSLNAPGAVDVNVGTCGCVQGSGIGIFSNTSEQLLLLSSSGILQDAVVWGGGQFPVNVTSGVSGGCTPVSAFFGQPGAAFETLPAGGGQGCTLARACDGASAWEERCTATSYGSSNGVPPVLSMSASQEVLCAGECVDFSAVSSVPPLSWTWSFPGSSSPSAEGSSVQSVCYPDADDFDVSLTVTTACGDFILEAQGLISVLPVPTPSVTPQGPTTLCEGESVVLQCNAPGPWQWYLNGVPIAGTNASQFTADEPGSYMVEVYNGVCSGTSQPVQVNVTPAVPPVLAAMGSTVLCPGGQVLLQASGGTGVFSWWKDGSLLPGEAGVTYVADTPGSYSVTSGSGSCVLSSNVIEVDVVDLPMPAVSASADWLCGNETAMLQVLSGQPPYTWLLNGSVLPGESGSSLVAGEAGSYQVQHSMSGCTATSDPVAIGASPLPEVVIAGNNPAFLCGGDSIQLTAQGADFFQWYRDNAPLTGQTAPSVWVSHPGVYIVVGTDLNGCSAPSVAVQVVQVQADTPVISHDAPPQGVCEGGTIVFSASGSWQAWQWTFNGLVLSSDQTLQVQQSGVGTLEVVSPEGCAASAAFAADFLSAPVPLVIAPQGTGACLGEVIPLVCQDWPQLNWYFNGTLFAEETATVEISVSGTVAVEVVGVNGCSGSSDPLDVVIHVPQQVEIMLSDAFPCEGESVTASLNQAYPSVLWSNGAQAPSTAWWTPAWIWVEVADAHGCATRDSTEIVFLPAPSADAGPDLISDCSGGVMIGATASGGSIQWSPADGLNDPFSARPLAQPSSTTIYTLSVTNGSCAAVDEVMVVADCYSFFAPNSFTPDGDGVNDAFAPVVRGAKEYSLTVFDRWGTVIFSSPDPGHFWNGSVRGGSSFAEAGPYAWRCVVRFGDRVSEEVYSGFVMLLK